MWIRRLDGLNDDLIYKVYIIIFLRCPRAKSYLWESVPHMQKSDSSTWVGIIAQNKLKDLLPNDAFFFSSFRALLNRRHHISLVVTLLVSVHQEFQASQETLDPQDQQVLRDHQAIMDLKDPWAHEETRVMKELVENKASQAPRELQDPQVQQDHLETRVMQVLVEAKVPQAPRELQSPWDVTGNSAFLRI